MLIEKIKKNWLFIFGILIILLPIYFAYSDLKNLSLYALGMMMLLFWLFLYYIFYYISKKGCFRIFIFMFSILFLISNPSIENFNTYYKNTYYKQPSFLKKDINRKNFIFFSIYDIKNNIGTQEKDIKIKNFYLGILNNFWIYNSNFGIYSSLKYSLDEWIMNFRIVHYLPKSLANWLIHHHEIN